MKISAKIIIVLAVIAIGCGTEAVRKGTVKAVSGKFTDRRNAKTYRTVEIGGLAWMAENLNFVTDSSACYNNDESYCEKYGRLYNWNDAMKACPAGWRVPSDEDWSCLARAAGGRYIGYDGSWRFAGRRLKSTMGWADRKDYKDSLMSGGGIDSFGFSALPGGRRANDGLFDNVSYNGYWWSATENGTTLALYRHMDYWSDGEWVGRGSAFKGVLISLRCVSGSGAGCKNIAVRRNAVPVPDVPGSGSFTDLRDGKKYRTVKIGNQRWMAENLKYKTGVSACYNEEDNCQTLGLNYDWNTAQMACPAGWHLPSDEEWDTLVMFVDPNYESGKNNVAGKKLKARSGWEDYRERNGNGTDEYGFSALPNGDEGLNPGSSGIWWTATYGDKKRGATRGRSRGMLYSDDVVSTGYSDEDFRLYVRCVENTGESDGKVVARKDSVPAAQKVEAVQIVPVVVPGGGTFTDKRDGKKYRTVRIGNLTWMAENLSFETAWSSCHKNDYPDCARYGRFYEWRDVMKACPAGWRAPSDADWENLALAVGGRLDRYGGWIGAAKKLKSKTVWSNNQNGTDEFGFSALPIEVGGSIGWRGYWWTNAESSAENARYWEIEGDDLKKRSCIKSSMRSLRCVQP